MLPYIYIGQLKISAYYTAMLLGYILMVVLMLLKSRRERYRLIRTRSFIFATTELVFGVLGCKILYILENIAWIRKNGFAIGGFSFYGAVFLIPLAMPLIGKLMKLTLRESLDNSAVCILAMLGTIRIGCYLNGCCGGRVLSFGDFSFTLPTQLIECVCDCIILIHLLKCEKKGTCIGHLYPRFLWLYGGARFLIEFIRNTDTDWLYLSHAQWFSIIAIIFGIAFEIILNNKSKQETQAECLVSKSD